MLQDYAIVYEIALSEDALKELTKSIRASKYYNSDVLFDKYFTKEMFVDCHGMRAAWVKAPRGYRFLNDWDLDIYSADVDTIARKATFEESHD